MKFRLLSSFFLFFICFNLSAQGNWEVLTPTPTHKDLFDTHFVTQNKGWAIGGGTILHTVDGGENWETQYENDEDEIGLNDMFFISENEGWAVGSEFILHTEDGGNSWEVKTVTYWINLRSVHFINHDIGWIVGSYNRIYKTINGGENWMLVESGGYEGPALEDVYFTDALHGVVVGRQEITAYNQAFTAVTEDGGETWTETTPSGFENLTIIQFVSDDIAFASGQDGKLLKTNDGGYTWEVISNFTSSTDDIYFVDENLGYLFDCCDIYKTNDGGENWKILYSGNPFLDFNAFTFIDTIAYAVGFHGDIFKSSYPYEEWEDLTSLPIGHFYDIRFINTLNGRAIANKSNRAEICITDDGGRSWEFVDMATTDNIWDISTPSLDFIYAIGNSSYLYKSTDAGKNWEHIYLDLHEGFNTVEFYNEQIGFIGYSEGIILKTNDGGTSWEDITLNSNGIFYDIQWINENNIWAADKNGYIFHSTDGGITWTELSFDGTINKLYFFNEQKGYIFCSTTYIGSLYMTEDGGNSWEMVYNYYPSNRVKIAFSSENEGWILTGSTLHYSSDEGITWELISHSFHWLNDLIFIEENTGWMCGANSLIVKYSNTSNLLKKLTNSNLNAFPNPTKDIITISLPELTKEKTSKKRN